MIKFKSFLAISMGVVVASMSGCSTKTSQTTTAQAQTSEQSTQVVQTTSSAEYFADEDFQEDYSGGNEITFSGDSITGEGVNISGTTATITSSGTYVFSGELNDGQIVVNSTGNGTVRVILKNATISNSQGAAISILQADKTIVTIPTGTTSTLSDGSAYAENDEATASIYSKDDLTINGGGILNIAGNFND
ncbi:MAG: carbohydrate-binding domain-containing protein, partial [Anaerotignaceae bacterium]